MSAVVLARLLKPFGIKPKQIRIGQDSRKGYDLSDFADAFDRYLPGESKHPKQVNKHKGNQGISTRNNESSCFDSESAETPSAGCIVSGVSGQQENPPYRAGGHGLTQFLAFLC